MATPRPIGKHYSISQLNQYKKCPASWYFGYVEKIKFIPGSSLVLGRAVHKAIELNFKQKITSYMDLPLSDVIREYYKSFDKEAITATFREDENIGEIREGGAKILTMFHTKRSPEIFPAKVEEPFEIMVLGHLFVGRIDLIDESGMLMDIKTSSKTPSDISADYLLQLTMYSRAKGLTQCRLETMVNKKQPDCITQVMEITDAHQKHLDNVIKGVVCGMENQVIYTNRESFLCSDKWCSYWKECHEYFGE